ncbi:MAG: hypothetical protein FWB83_08710 [Treponema sp.]|nr:hypothetical protein [Treponema sp.]
MYNRNLIILICVLSIFFLMAAACSPKRETQPQTQVTAEANTAGAASTQTQTLSESGSGNNNEILNAGIQSPQAQALAGYWHRRGILEEGEICSPSWCGERSNSYIFGADGSYERFYEAETFRHYILQSYDNFSAEEENLGRSSFGYKGRWNLSGNNITIHIIEEYHQDEVEWKSCDRTENVLLTIVNSNNINLAFQNGDNLDLARCVSPMTQRFRNE